MNLVVSERKRVDIQVLRGIAVLAVVAYHAGLGWIDSGFLGVDVFFVISGFLITLHLRSQALDGRLNLKVFYMRRARRLLPSACAVLGVVALTAPFLLSYTELKNLFYQLLGSLVHIPNIVLWRQADYFASDAQLKPLLHFWSLGVEEQFYLFLPLLFLFLPRRLWSLTIISGLIFSYLLMLFLGPLKPTVTFFLLPTRVWELLVGSCSALVINDIRVRRWACYLYWPALATIPVLLFKKEVGLHPGFAATVICLATSVVILARHQSLNSKFCQAALGRVGDLSYSLYLVHWPLFAYMNNVWMGEGAAPIAYRIILLVVAFFLAYFLRRYIEVPMMKPAVLPRWRGLGAYFSFSAVICFFVLAFIWQSPYKDFDSRRAANYGLSPVCDYQTVFLKVLNVPHLQCQRCLYGGILMQCILFRDSFRAWVTKSKSYRQLVVHARPS